MVIEYGARPDEDCWAWAVAGGHFETFETLCRLVQPDIATLESAEDFAVEDITDMLEERIDTLRNDPGGWFDAYSSSEDSSEE